LRTALHLPGACELIVARAKRVPGGNGARRATDANRPCARDRRADEICRFLFLPFWARPGRCLGKTGRRRARARHFPPSLHLAPLQHVDLLSGRARACLNSVPQRGRAGAAATSCVHATPLCATQQIVLGSALDFAFQPDVHQPHPGGPEPLTVHCRVTAQVSNKLGIRCRRAHLARRGGVRTSPGCRGTSAAVPWPDAPSARPHPVGGESRLRRLQLWNLRSIRPDSLTRRLPSGPPLSIPGPRGTLALWTCAASRRARISRRRDVPSSSERSSSALLTGWCNRCFQRETVPVALLWHPSKIRPPLIDRFVAR
jgi:hypothetical protein